VDGDGGPAPAGGPVTATRRAPAAVRARSLDRPAATAALAGTAAVVLSLAGGKWGAYLGVPPVFPIDVLLAGAVAALTAGAALRRLPAAAPGRRWPYVPLLALLGCAVLRFAAGRDHGLVAIRDLAPYGYATAALLAAFAYRRATPGQRERTAVLLRAALLFHLAWVAVVRVWPAVALRMPYVSVEQDLRLFGIRLASDGTVVGVTAALYLVRLVRARGRGSAAVLVGCLVLIADMSTRAALLSTAVALAVAVGVSIAAPDGGRVRGRTLALLGLLPLVTAAVALALPHTTAGSKLLSSIGLRPVESSVDATGIGTKQGRSEAWRLVVDYVAHDHAQLAGVGFGPDFLYESGGRAPLGNDEDLRAPHNFFVNTYARLGLVGLVLLAAVLIAFALAAVRVRRAVPADDLLALSVLLPVAFVVTAAVGVQIESPFGAVPFWWCLGIVLAAGADPRPVGPGADQPE
jgi:O-antigen ligase